jgi:hypothetical protein
MSDLRQSPPTGTADFHFLFLAPGVSPDYFFVAARRYWQAFKTIVIYDLSLVEFVPSQYQIAITTLARSDSAAAVRDAIQTNFGPNVYHDALVYDFLEDMQLTLEARAQRNEPFGVPLEAAS